MGTTDDGVRKDNSTTVRSGYECTPTDNLQGAVCTKPEPAATVACFPLVANSVQLRPEEERACLSDVLEGKHKIMRPTRCGQVKGIEWSVLKIR